MMGSALTWPLRDNNHEVRLVGTHLDRDIIQSIKATRRHPKLDREMPKGVISYFDTQIEDAVKHADCILSGVSSFGIEWFAGIMNKYLDPDVPILSVTKGLVEEEKGTLTIIPEALNDLLTKDRKGKFSINAIGGPCISHELATRRHTWVVFCGKDKSTLNNLRSLFSSDYYHIRLSNDVIGVEVCAALKNAYALGVGLIVGEFNQIGANGKAKMYNPQAALFAQSCFEIDKFLNILGGDRSNVQWLPGSGDLYVTVFGGRTVQLGTLLGEGKTINEALKIMEGETLESIEIITRVSNALPKLSSKGILNLNDFPLMNHLNQIINHNAPVNIPWNAFFHDVFI